MGKSLVNSTVLIVEDARISLEMVSRLLLCSSVREVLEAGDGVDAVERRLGKVEAA